MYLVRLDESTYWFIHLISLSLVVIPSICLFACIVYVIHFSRLIFFTIVHFPVSNHSNAKGGCFAFICREISKLTFYSGKYIESVLVYVSLEESIWCYLLYCWHRVSVSFHFVKYMVWICPFHCTKYTYGLLSIYVMNCIYIILWQRKGDRERRRKTKKMRLSLRMAVVADWSQQ